MSILQTKTASEVYLPRQDPELDSPWVDTESEALLADQARPPVAPLLPSGAQWHRHHLNRLLTTTHAVEDPKNSASVPFDLKEHG
ncbi:uncharacterized protein PGTG_22356 [Puccinia graminis f. sp. tritici CRL 75-36-700-3]|uniref:Uncharacterized protein n=1 Tax=Puccinia graminis f. sp. tritici (strain CRL 75-36-700-3 / race SCCL) TaxID=418459 RepID=H6QU62_PUCGT|nr:uncharacterized protein PGTG_22356 [Puccinia graminis f. sp. tritici CRL 75-36-700-3]EHS64476.1 hypothetical protein PGTG_22356 [Puccinia graminis f. sp. tritici CRL 75-36-700-3]